MPCMFCILIPFGGFFIRGSLSITLNILAAACLPKEIDLKAGVNWLKLKSPIKTLKKIISTLPAVYVCLEIL